MTKFTFSFTDRIVRALKVGDAVLISGGEFTGLNAIHRLKILFLSLTLLLAVSVRAQLPTASPKAAGFDLAWLELNVALKPW